MNKNKFSIWIFVLVLLSSLALAIPSFPVPVSGVASLNGVPLTFVDVSMKNLQTKDSVVVRSDEHGYFRADWSSHRWYPSSNLEISIVGCDRTECKTVVVMTGDPIRNVNFPLQGVITEVVSKFKCWNGKIVLKESDCPVVEVPKSFVCEDGNVVDTKDKCVVEPVVVKDDRSVVLNIALGILSGLLTIAVGVLSKFKWGKGFVGLANYYKRKGDVEFKNENYALAKKNYLRAAKMLSTAMKHKKKKLVKLADKC